MLNETNFPFPHTGMWVRERGRDKEESKKMFGGEMMGLLLCYLSLGLLISMYIYVEKIVKYVQIIDSEPNKYDKGGKITNLNP